MKHARPDYNRMQDPAGLIPADEPVFLLRGQDRAAPAAVMAWVDEARAQGAEANIVDAALAQADAMMQWQDSGRGDKVPDMPDEGHFRPPAQTSDAVSSLASKWLHHQAPTGLTNSEVLGASAGARWVSYDYAMELLGEARTMAASLLRQDETKGSSK